MALPQVGDLQGYVTTGHGLIVTAQAASAGDPNAAASLLQDGVTVIREAAGSNQAVAAVATALGAGVTGFMVGGPIGAVAGFVGSVGAQLLASGSEKSTQFNPGALTAADRTIQAGLFAWPAPVRELVVGAPPGWSLYTAWSQSPAGAAWRHANAAHTIQVCPAFVWLLDPNQWGCAGNQGFPENGDQPDVQARAEMGAEQSITVPPGMNAQSAVQAALARTPDFSFADQGLSLGGPDTSPPGQVGADANLGLATVFAMLQAGAIDKSIASELLMQHAIRHTLDAGWAPSPRFARLTAFYLSRANAQAGGGAFAFPTRTLSGPLLSLTLPVTNALDAWTRYYLDQGPRP